MLAGDLVWITPEDMHHFLSEGAVLAFLRRQMAADLRSRYVDLSGIKSSPSADNVMTVAYEVTLVSREEESERPLRLRCSMAICRRGRQLEITFLHFSKKPGFDGTEQLRDFVTNLPCGVMILACLDGRREEAVFYNAYFARRLRYGPEEFARAMRRNPFFMTSEEDRERIQEEIEKAGKSGGNIAANIRFYRKDGNSFFYRMAGVPAYQADGGTVYYCVFQETTGFQLTTERLQGRLDTANELLRQIPEAFCGIEIPAGAALAADHARVFFTSKNIPALFGVSNSAYMKNILEDPFYGLEITSITRDRLLSSYILNPEKASAGKPVSCGVFRLKKQDGKPGGKSAREADGKVSRVELVIRRTLEKDGTARLYLFYYDCEAQQQEMEKRVDRAMQMGRAGQEQLRADLRKAKENASRRLSEANAALKEAKEKHAAELSRTEDQLAEEKNRSALMARQLEETRAALKQVAADLARSESDAARRIRNMLGKAEADAVRRIRDIQAEADRRVKAAEADAVRRIGDIQAEADRNVKAAREREDTARKQADQRIQEAQERSDAAMQQADAEKQRAGETLADAVSKTKDAAAARDLLEEQLREAEARCRRLEALVRKETARRQVLEEQYTQLKNSLPAEPVFPPLPVNTRSTDTGSRDAGSAYKGSSNTDSSSTGFINKGAAGTSSSNTGMKEYRTAEQMTAKPFGIPPAEDWMTADNPVTVYSHLDPVPGDDRRTGSSVQAAGTGPDGPDAAPGGNRKRTPHPGFLEESFSPEQWIREILEQEETICRKKDISLRYYCDSRLPRSVTGFADLLRHALLELLENAVARTRSGGRIAVHCRADRPSGGLVNLYFRIDDNGASIPEKSMQAVFRPQTFAELEKSTVPEDTEEFEESIPGEAALPTAREAAALMGGSIHARSAEGNTRFSFQVAMHCAP